MAGIQSVVKPKAKKFSSGENNVLRFWDSIQTKGLNKVVQNKRYKADLDLLRKEFGSDVVKSVIFGLPNDKKEEYLKRYDEITKTYESLQPKDILTIEDANEHFKTLGVKKTKVLKQYEKDIDVNETIPNYDDNEACHSSDSDLPEIKNSLYPNIEDEDDN